MQKGQSVRKAITELIGTFFLILTIGDTGIAAGPGVIPPLAIGSVLMVMIYAGGHVSGGHYNPGVTLGVWLRGRLSASELLPYWAAQILGAVAAAMIIVPFRGEAPETFHGEYLRVFIAEFLFSFALVYVVLNVATAKATAGNSYFGLAIGFTVLVGAFAVGHVSGGAFNPAVAVGAMIMGMLPWGKLWLYLVAQLLGAAAAALAFKTMNPEDK